MPVGVTVLQPAAGKSYITTRNSTTYNFQKEDYCYAGFCGKTGHPLNGCPWAQPHCPPGWTMLDTSTYEEAAGCATPYSDMECVATCVTSAVCSSP
eukprot:gene21808-934_t